MKSTYLIPIGLAIATRFGTLQPDTRSEIVGWSNVLTALISEFATCDVITLGEAHGRQVDAELRLRLVRHDALPREMRLILTEFPDDQLSSAVSEVNSQRAENDRIQIVVGGSFSPTLVAERVRRGEKALIVYGAGHLWKREGRLTVNLSAAGVRVRVIQTLAPPTPMATLTQVAGLLRSTERPLLISLRNTDVGRLKAVGIFPGEPIAPSVELGDLADAAVVFTDTPLQATTPAGGPYPEQVAGSTIRLAGQLAGLFLKSRHVYLLLSVKSGGGGTERWAVRGGSLSQLTQLGWSTDPRQNLRLGDQLVADARIPPADADPLTLAPEAPWQVARAIKDKRFVFGVTVTLSDGRTLSFGAKP